MARQSSPTSLDGGIKLVRAVQLIKSSSAETSDAVRKQVAMNCPVMNIVSVISAQFATSYRKPQEMTQPKHPDLNTALRSSRGLQQDGRPGSGSASASGLLPCLAPRGQLQNPEFLAKGKRVKVKSVIKKPTSPGGPRNRRDDRRGRCRPGRPHARTSHCYSRSRHGRHASFRSLAPRGCR